jgi:6-phosphogluconolactonase
MKRVVVVSFLLVSSACGGDDVSSGAPHDASAPSVDAGDASSDGATNVTDGGSASDAIALDGSSDGGGAPLVPFVYVGSAGFSGREDNAIHVFSLDAQSGALAARGAPVAAGANPSYMAADPSRHFLYVVNESASAVAAFSLDQASGALSLVNRVPSGGSGPTHVSLDASGKFVLVANYTSGDATVLSRKADGSLGAVVGSRAFGSSAATHCMRTDPGGRFVFVANKDLNIVAQLTLDAAGALKDNTPPSIAPANGSGPRHIDFHPTRPFAYVIDENASAIDAYTYDANAGRLAKLQTISTLPAGFTGANTGAEIQVAPSGRFVYGSNRGDDSIVIFAIDQATGKLTLVGHQKTRGKTPRQFQIDSAGRFLLVGNQDSDNVAVFAVDPNAGTLTPLGGVTSVASPAYVGVVWLPGH